MSDYPDALHRAEHQLGAFCITPRKGIFQNNTFETQ